MSSQFPQCTRTLQKQGKPYPRTCAECGLGPCKVQSAPDQPTTPDALSNEQLAAELMSNACRSPFIVKEGAVIEAANRLRALAAATEDIPLNDDTRFILGMMCFDASRYAHLMQAAGLDVAKKAEDEQAAVICWLLNTWRKHGADWRKFASIQMNEWRDKVKALEAARAAGGAK